MSKARPSCKHGSQHVVHTSWSGFGKMLDCGHKKLLMKASFREIRWTAWVKIIVHRGKHGSTISPRLDQAVNTALSGV